jgi:hypothetical protein
VADAIEPEPVDDRPPRLVGVATPVVVGIEEVILPAVHVDTELVAAAVATEAEEGLGVELSLHDFAALATSSP